LTKLRDYRNESLEALAKVEDQEGLEEWYRRHLAPSGLATSWRRQIGSLPKQERPEFGMMANAVADELR